MNKINSTSSNNSGTSSETSESQSVEDVRVDATAIATVHANTRIPKSWKRMKDISNDKDAEAKRPPWRAVSVSTLPKPDKSAILRAKLLDASRRLRAAKSSVAIQTDMAPTKLLKEANLGIQTDLIQCRDSGVLTDGAYVKKKQGSDEFILTYSISQMTDTVQVHNVATQTLLPKVPGDDFMDAYLCNTDSKGDMSNLSPLEQKLLNQLQKIRNNPITKRPPSRETVEMADKTEQLLCTDSSYSETDTDTGTIVKPSGNKKTIQTETSSAFDDKKPTLLKPTLASWHFEFDDTNNEKGGNFQPYTIVPNTPWRAFTPLPLSLRDGANSLSNVDWQLFLLSVDELVQEANRLVDLTEHITQRQNEQQRAMEEIVPPFEQQKLVLPSEYWLPIIEQQEIELTEMRADVGPTEDAK